jgi:hypothetical protein
MRKGYFKYAIESMVREQLIHWRVEFGIKHLDQGANPL